MKQIIINQIDRICKFIQSDKTNNRMCIRIDYDNETDTWFKYSFYYNKEYRSDYKDLKELKTLEQVKEELINIYKNYGNIDYMLFDDNKVLKNFQVYN